VQEINNRLEAIMVRSFQAVVQEAERQQTSLRMGAYLLALIRAAEAIETRGVYP
jgi:glutamate dehydrogenase (NAD(P)+)